MRRSALPVLVLVVAAALGGCLSAEDSTGDPPTATTPATDAPTPTVVGTRTTTIETATTTERYRYDCGCGLTVNVASAHERNHTDRTTRYSNLSDARQAEFQRARNGTSADLGETLPEPWRSPVLVRFEGTQYWVGASTC